MSKDPNPDKVQAPPAPPRDWFVAAIESDGTVDASLEAVQRELAQKVSFVTAIRSRLAGDGRLDAVSALTAKIKALDNTLKFRLGILRPERPAAWFRAPAATSTGPFSSTLVAEPVFAQYEPRDVEKVSRGLEDAWTERRASPLPFRDGGPCLWRMLLTLNKDLDELDRLPEPFEHLRLSRLPEGLGSSLESRALRAFLINVRSEICASREKLDRCYDELRSESEKLWSHQRATAERETRQRPSEERQRAKHMGGRRPADDVREEFARRRRQSASLKTPKDVEALRYMGFDDLPSPDSLRSRYLQLARKFHPDAEGGSDDAFKMLTRAYSHLNGRVTGR